MPNNTVANGQASAPDAAGGQAQVEMSDVLSSRPPNHIPLEEDIMQLARLGEIALIQKLFDSKKFGANYKDEQGITPLHWAAINNHYALCHFLIQAGADINARGGDAVATPVLWAAKKCHYYVVDLLLKNGADPLLTDDQGYNLLHSATLDGNIFQIVLLLHQDGIDVDTPDRTGHTSLMWAAYKGYPQVVDLLLRWGANVHARDEQGFTALHWALVKGQLHSIFKLVEYGSDRFAENNEAKTPAITAREMKSMRQWHMALSENGYRPDGSPRPPPLGIPGIKDNKMFFQRFFFLYPFVVIFMAMYFLSHVVIYISLPATFLGVYLLQMAIKKLFKYAPNDMSTYHKTPFLAGVFAGTLFWTGLRWISVVFLHTMSSAFLWNFLFAGAFGLCAFFYFKTMTGDPGYVPKLSGRNEQKAVIDELLEQRKFDETNFCVSCMVRRPLRSKHCKKCGRCTAKQDHHCPWVDNCVGVNNHRHFVMYVLTLAIGIVLYDMVIWQYFTDITPSTDKTCTFLSEEYCALLNADPFTASISIWATVQLVWVSMLLIVQLVQVARGLTTYEAMSSHGHGHKHATAGDAFNSFVATGDPSMAAAGITSANRGPDPAAGPLPYSHGHHQRPQKVGCWSTWTHMLGIDTFLATAMFGSKANERMQSRAKTNPFSRGVFTNCQDFWCDSKPMFRSSENSGEARLGGERVDYTSMYSVPARMRMRSGGGNSSGPGYEAVGSEDV